jgi:hypothetical protein
VDKNVSRPKIGVDHAVAVDIGEGFGQLSTPYYALAQVGPRVVVDVGLEIAVACLAE